MFDRLESLQENSSIGMSKNKYLEMQEQLGNEPDPARCPPDYEDLPDICRIALQIFNNLGDRVYPDIGYIGKDYTNLKIFMDLYEIQDKDLFMEILSRLDGFAIKQSQEKLKREYDKMKSKSRG